MLFLLFGPAFKTINISIMCVARKTCLISWMLVQSHVPCLQNEMEALGTFSISATIYNSLHLRKMQYWTISYQPPPLQKNEIQKTYFSLLKSVERRRVYSLRFVWGSVVVDMVPAAVTLQIWTAQHRGFIVPTGTDLGPSQTHRVKEVWGSRTTIWLSYLHH